MFRNSRNYFVQNRYSIAVFVLLNLACAICIGLVFARVAYSEFGSASRADLESLPGLDSLHAGVFRARGFMAAGIALSHHPVHRLFVADLLPERALHAHRPAGPGTPRQAAHHSGTM